MITNPQILSDLRLMRENNQPVELMNIYKGVPFVCKGRILEIDGDRVQLQVDTAELVCLQNDGTTRVLGNDYFEPSSAQVESVDLTTGTVILHNFTYVGTRLGERMIVRVEPEEPIPVLIHTEDHPVFGEVIDLSMSGLGIRVSVEHYQPVLKPGSAVHVTTTLPSGEITLHGAIMSITKRPDFYRLSVRFTAEHDYKVIIFHYLVDRRSEIEAELRRQFEQIRAASRQ